MTKDQKIGEALRVARLSIGRKTVSRGMTVEAARVDDRGMIRVTFAGTGPAPFREALYTPAEVLRMVGAR